MSPTTALLAIAQIAATFAGFTALMSLVRPTEDREHRVIAAFRVKMVLTQALMTLFLCLVPIFLSQLGWLEFRVWQVSNIIFVIVAFTRTSMAVRSIQAVQRTENTKVNPYSVLVNFSASCTAIGLAIVALAFPNLVNLSASYVFGCIAMLFISGVAFAFLVHQLSPDAAN